MARKEGAWTSPGDRGPRPGVVRSRARFRSPPKRLVLRATPARGVVTVAGDAGPRRRLPFRGAVAGPAVGDARDEDVARLAADGGGVAAAAIHAAEVRRVDERGRRQPPLAQAG